MDEERMSPEELIHGMRPDEICELLDEFGIEVTSAQAVAIQGLINRLGSLKEAIKAIAESEDSTDQRSIA